MNVALLTELMVTRERLDTLERLIEARGLVPRSDIDAYQPDDAAEAQRRGAAGRERVVREFSPARIAARWHEAVGEGTEREAIA